MTIEVTEREKVVIDKIRTSSRFAIIKIEKKDGNIIRVFTEESELLDKKL